MCHEGFFAHEEVLELVANSVVLGGSCVRGEAVEEHAEIVSHRTVLHYRALPMLFFLLSRCARLVLVVSFVPASIEGNGKFCGRS